MGNFDYRSILVDGGSIVQCTWNRIVVFLYMLAPSEHLPSLVLLLYKDIRAPQQDMWTHTRSVRTRPD